MMTRHIFSKRCSTILGLSAVVWSACSSITIVHQDPQYPRVSVVVDHGETELLDVGEEVSISVSKGVHLIEAMPEGENRCPWTENGGGWTVWVEKDAVLTLLPTVDEAEEASGEDKGIPAATP